MKAILFTTIICCLIVAVDAQTLVTQPIKDGAKKRSAVAESAASQNMKDNDARFYAAE